MANLWKWANSPAVLSLIAFGILIAIGRFFLPFHHTAATKDGVLFVECVVLTLLLGAAIWDKSQFIGRSLRAGQSEHHELFSWNEIGKVLACLGALMAIFVAVVKVLDLKAANQGAARGELHAERPK